MSTPTRDEWLLKLAAVVDEPECGVPDCTKAALWSAVTEPGCDCPKRHCQPHRDERDQQAAAGWKFTCIECGAGLFTLTGWRRCR